MGLAFQRALLRMRDSLGQRGCRCVHKRHILEIGASIPPLGVNLFISSIRFERPVLRLYWASLPFIAVLLVALAIITYLPWLSLALLR